MRSPSSRVLDNDVDWFASILAQDPAGAYVPTYPAVPTRRAIPCSVQQQQVEEIIEELPGGQVRLTRLFRYKVHFGYPDPGVQPRDKLIWRDSRNVSRILIVQPTKDNASRRSMFTVFAVERL